MRLASWSTSAMLAGTLALAAPGCGALGNDAVSDSEVSTSVVSGALNSAAGSMVGYNALPRVRRGLFERALEALNPIATAFAATWTCTGGALSPSFSGPGQDPYTFTPVSCTVNWGAGKTASAKWSGGFTVVYGASCDDKHALLELQAASCSITRTTATGGNTRTITGPEGNDYAITHDTQGAGTGWDVSVSPAPTSDGVVAACDAAGCAAGRSLVIHGSHLHGTVTPKNGVATKIWDHTVSTGANPLKVSGVGANRVVSGEVTVQHNLAMYTATTTFNAVTYADGACCFPTSGNVTTAFVSGPHAGKSETLAFGAVCGQATLTGPNGGVSEITLQHCL